MENKEVASVRTVTGELIGGFFLYGILFGVLYSIIFYFVSKVIPEDSYMLSAIISVILNGFLSFITWRCSIFTTFRKRTINQFDINTVMRNLIVFIIIIYIINTAFNFKNINDKLNQLINSNSSFAEKYMDYFYDDDEIKKYQEEKEKTIKEVKNKLYPSFILLNSGLLAVNIVIVLMQKKYISKNSI